MIPTLPSQTLTDFSPVCLSTWTFNSVCEEHLFSQLDHATVLCTLLCARSSSLDVYIHSQSSHCYFDVLNILCIITLFSANSFWLWNLRSHSFHGSRSYPTLLSKTFLQSSILFSVSKKIYRSILSHRVKSLKYFSSVSIIASILVFFSCMDLLVYHFHPYLPLVN